MKNLFKIKLVTISLTFYILHLKKVINIFLFLFSNYTRLYINQKLRIEEQQMQIDRLQQKLKNISSFENEMKDKENLISNLKLVQIF